MTKDKKDKGLFKTQNDYVFKRIFGNENNKDILIPFLKDVLEFEINEVEILNSEITKENLTDKGSLLDVKVKINNNPTVDIEIQVAPTTVMPERSLYYWSKMYVEDLKSGEDYTKLKKKICINILNYNHFETNQYHTKFKIKEDKKHFALTDMLEIHFIELPKVVEYNQNDKLSAWIIFFNAKNEEELDKVANLNPAIKKAVKVVKVMSQDEKEREAYNMREKALHDIATFIKEGEKIGEKKGETKKAIKVIKNMLALNADIDFISKSTELSIEEILKIKEEMNL